MSWQHRGKAPEEREIMDYEIVNTSSGECLGSYAGETPRAAIAAMLADAGIPGADPSPELVAVPLDGEADADSPFTIPLGMLAEEYGVPLDHLGEFGGGDLTEYADTPVEISHDEEGWHVGGELTDDDWAPQSDAQAADLRKAALAAE